MYDTIPVVSSGQGKFPGQTLQFKPIKSAVISEINVN